jgi:hypothetical protein
VPTGFNVPFEGSLLVGAYYAVRTLLLDEVTFPEHVPQNDGVFRPVTVIAPKGTIFNPNFPRACFSRFCQVQRVVDNTILALADQLPEQVTAGNSVDNLMANTRNNPIEELDLRFPLRCDQYELRPEPAAPGRWRGGVGIIRRNRFLVDGTFSCEGDRQWDPPRGVFGGWDGLSASGGSRGRFRRLHDGGAGAGRPWSDLRRGAHPRDRRCRDNGQAGRDQSLAQRRERLARRALQPHGRQIAALRKPFLGGREPRLWHVGMSEPAAPPDVSRGHEAHPLRGILRAGAYRRLPVADRGVRRAAQRVSHGDGRRRARPRRGDR